ncbi:hypothetical protein BJX99DRAFT_258638 [Aspergillus californicus]
MKFTTAISLLAVAGSALATALPQDTPDFTAMVQEVADRVNANSLQQRDTSNCVGDLLCCGTLTTPLDSTVDPILLELGVNAANIVGSIGLLCHTYGPTCETPPQCCTEANLLGGTVALGCADL